MISGRLQCQIKDAVTKLLQYGDAQTVEPNGYDLPVKFHFAVDGNGSLRAVALSPCGLEVSSTTWPAYSKMFIPTAVHIIVSWARNLELTMYQENEILIREKADAPS